MRPRLAPIGTAPLPDPFIVDDCGVWHVARDAEGNDKRPVWLRARHVESARADDANGWGCLLEFADLDGDTKTWAMRQTAKGPGQGAQAAPLMTLKRRYR